MNGHQIIADTLMTGGGTYDLVEVERVSPATGYAVALDGGWTVFLGDYSDQMLDHAAHMVNDAVAYGRLTMTVPYIGTWIDGDTLYIDRVIIMDSKEDALARARHERQLAIYDFATGESIETGVRQ